MIFSSLAFLFLFLPLVLLASLFLKKEGQNFFLLMASLFFYAWGEGALVLLLLASALLNHVLGRAIAAAAPRWRRTVLVAGLAFNLGLLAACKYAAFIAANLNPLLHAVGLRTWTVATWPMPLGISFFTFMAIAYLAEVYNRSCPAEKNFLHTALFIAFFPTVLAGPIHRYSRLRQQLSERETTPELLASGIRRFILGLGKKALLADTLARTADQVFAVPGSGLTSGLAWLGAVCYSLQIFLDFSGYSDMAVGLSLLFGVRLPVNFHSPYKAVNIIDFWRRWHMTLSRFLRDYLYIPLGGNRYGAARRYVNLAATMLLGGLWHGASWTFVVWGGLHGFYLLVNHAWRGMRLRARLVPLAPAVVRRALAVALTFLATVVGWVFFRAESLAAARLMLEGMAGLHGVVMPYPWLARLGEAGAWLAAHGVEFRHSTTFAGGSQLNWILVSMLIVWAAPNTQQILARFPPALAMPDPSAVARRWWQWRPGAAWLVVTLIAAAAAILSLTEVSEFIYFQF